MIREAIAEYSQSLQVEWAHDRTKTVGGSEIGQCARKVHFVKSTNWKRAPIAVGQGGWGAAIRGKVMEDEFWYPALKNKFGAKLTMAGPQQETLQEGTLSSTPDGLLVNVPRSFLQFAGVDDLGPSKAVLLECKTIDPRASLREAKDENVFQVQVALGMVRKKKKVKVDYALITYLDASFWDTVTEFAVKFDPEVFAAAERRSREVLEGPFERLRPEGYIVGGAECEHCPCLKQCGVARRSVPVLDATADPQFAAEVTDMTREILEAKVRVKDGEATVKLLEDDLKSRLREKGVRRVPGVVTWSAVKGRDNWDYKGLKQAAADAGVDVDSFSTAGDPTDRLQINL